MAPMLRAPPPDTIDLWTTALAESEAGRWPLLSADERVRAERFHFARDRVAFVAARGWLRLVLARYLSCGPDRIAFGYGQDGKPHLVPDEGAPDLRFNLSHSGGRAALAVASAREVGIDLERIRPVSDDLAARFFAPSEVAGLDALPKAQRLGAFFAVWARKEAYVKALGAGLTVRLDGFEVSHAPGAPAEVLAVAADVAEAARWRILDLPPVPGFAGAVAARWTGWRLVPMREDG